LKLKFKRKKLKNLKMRRSIVACSVTLKVRLPMVSPAKFVEVKSKLQMAILLSVLSTKL
jgi:hypothetical protein